MPLSERELQVRRALAARYLSHAISGNTVPTYLGARLAGMNMTDTNESTEQGPMVQAISKIKDFFSETAAASVGPYFVVALVDGAPATRFPVNDLLVFPSMELARPLSDWLRPLLSSDVCAENSKQLIGAYCDAGATGDWRRVLAAGSRLSDCFDDDWGWHRIGLKYARQISDVDGFFQHLEHLMLLPRERSELLNVLTRQFQRVVTEVQQPLGIISTADKTVILSLLLRFGHLPWAGNIGLCAVFANSQLAPADVTAIVAMAQEVADVAGPAFWHQLWQAVVSSPSLRAEEPLRKIVTERFIALCKPDQTNPSGRRTALYNALMQYFFCRLETQFRGIVPLGNLWNASKLASDLEQDLVGLEDKLFEPVFGYITEMQDKERQVWSICSLDVEPSGYHDVYANKNSLWAMSLGSLPSSVPIDTTTIGADNVKEFKSMIQSIGFVFAIKPETDSDNILPVLNLLARDRLKDWLTLFNDPALSDFITAADKANEQCGTNKELLERLKDFPTLSANDGYVVLLVMLARLRARMLTGKEILELIGTDEWIKSVLPKLSEQALDFFLSVLTGAPVVGQRDDAIGLAHWGAIAFATAPMSQEGLQSLATAAVLMAMKASAFSAVKRLNGTPNEHSGYDAQSDVQYLLDGLEAQTPLWVRGRVRAVRVSLLPVAT